MREVRRPYIAGSASSWSGSWVLWSSKGVMLVNRVSSFRSSAAPISPNDTIFEEALFFRVSFLPSAPRDLPSEWSGQLNKPLNPTLHSSTPFNSAPLRSTTAQCCNLRQILSWTVLAEQKSSCIRYKQVRPSVSTEVKLQWTCLNLSKLESSVETKQSGTCIWKCLKSADVTLDLNLQISVFPFTLTPPAMAKLCKSVEKERSCWILFCCRL